MIFGTVGTEALLKTLFWKLKSLSIRDLRAGGGRGRKSLRLNDLRRGSLACCVPSQGLLSCVAITVIASIIKNAMVDIKTVGSGTKWRIICNL